MPPVGDHVYNNLMSGHADIYACTKTRAHHTHSVSCLSRRHFIPTGAVKFTSENVIGNFLTETELSASRYNNNNNHHHHNGGSEVNMSGGGSEHTSQQKTTGRTSATSIACFFADGTKIEARSTQLSTLLPPDENLGRNRVLV